MSHGQFLSAQMEAWRVCVCRGSSPLASGSHSISRHTKVNRPIFISVSTLTERAFSHTACLSLEKTTDKNPPFINQRGSLEENLQPCDATAASYRAMIRKVLGRRYSSYFFCWQLR